MKSNTLTIIIVCLQICLAQHALSREKIIDFEFDGVKSTSTLSDLKSKYSDLELIKSNCELWSTKLAPQANMVRFRIYKGKVSSMQVFYYSNKLNRIGGAEALHDRLVVKYGKEDTDTRPYAGLHCYSWEDNKPNAQLLCTLLRADDSACVIWADRDATGEEDKVRQSNVSVGF